MQSVMTVRKEPIRGENRDNDETDTRTVSSAGASTCGISQTITRTMRSARQQMQAGRRNGRLARPREEWRALN